MKPRALMIGVVVFAFGASLLLGVEEPSEDVCELGWQTIKVRAIETPEKLEIDQEVHDLGVGAPGAKMYWCLECVDCGENTVWRLTNFRLLADLDVFSTTAVLLAEDYIEDESIRKTAQEIGVVDPEDGVMRAQKAFEFTPPGWQEWANHNAPITAESKLEKENPQELLWKFNIEVCKEGFNRDDPCSDKDHCNCWDPHKYTIPGS